MFSDIFIRLGISVTPVVGFIGEVSQLTFKTNRDEVEDLFSISLSDLLDDKKWILKDRSAPIYIGGNEVDQHLIL